jgi:pyruvate dehydrogenase (quinone)
MKKRVSGLHRREFIQAAAAGAALVGASGTAARADQLSETNSAISAQPVPAFGSDQTTADILVETLIAWGATHAFGIVGDGINPLIEALRKRQDRIRYIGVLHEEAAAFMAGGIAK